MSEVGILGGVVGNVEQNIERFWKQAMGAVWILDFILKVGRGL